MNKISAASTIAHSAIAVLIVGSAFAIASADAATQRTHYVSGTGACAGPIPSSDGALRRSPLGIRNQGTSAVFISCSVPADVNGDQTTGVIDIGFANFGGAAATVNCTMTAGNRNVGFGSVARSASVTAGGDGYVHYNSVDKNNLWGAYNFSCVLPPDVELNSIIFQDNDSGNGL